MHFIFIIANAEYSDKFIVTNQLKINYYVTNQNKNYKGQTRDLFICFFGKEEHQMAFCIDMYKTAGTVPKEGMELVFTQYPAKENYLTSLWIGNKKIAEF